MKRAHHMKYRLLSGIQNSFILKFAQFFLYPPVSHHYRWVGDGLKLNSYRFELLNFYNYNFWLEKLARII